MTSIRRRLGTAVAVVAVLAVGAPVATASAQIPLTGAPGAWFPGAAGTGGTTVGPQNFPMGPCATGTGMEDQGRAGGSNNQACLGAGLAFQGPQIGQVASVIGPTMIGPNIGVTSVVAAGNASGS
jgi:hypothetical protein